MEKKKIEWEKPELVEIGKSDIITHGGTSCGNGPTNPGTCSSGGYFRAP